MSDIQEEQKRLYKRAEENDIKLLKEEINRLNNIIDEAIEYLEYQLENLDFEEDTKAKMLGAMTIVLLKGDNK